MNSLHLCILLLLYLNSVKTNHFIFVVSNSFTNTITHISFRFSDITSEIHAFHSRNLTPWSFHHSIFSALIEFNSFPDSYYKYIRNNLNLNYLFILIIDLVFKMDCAEIMLNVLIFKKVKNVVSLWLGNFNFTTCLHFSKYLLCECLSDCTLYLF